MKTSRHEKNAFTIISQEVIIVLDNEVNYPSNYNVSDSGN